MSRVVLRYWAAARSAAGVDEEEYAGVDSLADLVDAAAERHPVGLARVLAVCSFLVDEQPAGTRDRREVLLADGAVVEALPPFAGG